MRILSTTRKNLSAHLAAARREQEMDPLVKRSVRDIIAAVQERGDEALFALTEKYDGAKLRALEVSKKEITEAYQLESASVIKSLKAAKRNIERFQKTTFQKKEQMVETQEGVFVWREFRAIELVGLYIPGGKAAYPSTVLMLAVPARIAGCREIVLCVPPDKNGRVPSAVLVAADLCGITKIFKVGGAQAIAGMAYGTKSIPKVSKIFGPGNQYVTAAKLAIYGVTDIDMPAGPSEVLVFADSTANPIWIAADLLSQLEHGEDSQAILVTPSMQCAKQVISDIFLQLEQLPRKKIIFESLKKSFAIVVDSIETGIAFMNGYAPEHLEIVAKGERSIARQITNAGSIFLGQYSSEPLGDYATGANHTLPTSGYARMFSALSVESFGKKIQMQRITKKGIAGLRDMVETLAEREGLDAHKNAVAIRFAKSSKKV